MFFLRSNNVFLMWYPVIVNQFFKSFETATEAGLDDRNFCDRVVANISSPTESENVSQYKMQ